MSADDMLLGETDEAHDDFFVRNRVTITHDSWHVLRDGVLVEREEPGPYC